eukprot:CAMPEP_0184336276 /NCGR_PEP_ID=MMETSP1089-20130417/4630_1 /TAXON_ID=38269 ORGANISM="Gloeochaete wittrockiana, Strain SAG46.84" /NCGR_SAMPLE_ID=MMETSP1089 /ASSEMBLY_ACC=CAM_ASM_000445 /LENGTH=2323 /DNA_ID=CAMNT_0026661255 /DNA_START=188 /DNA_END=7160 /DNA_ORIENTATION=+
MARRCTVILLVGLTGVLLCFCVLASQLRNVSSVLEAMPRIGPAVLTVLRPFLATELPLKVVSITPYTNSASADGDKDVPVELDGRTALTVVFSRAVIALGADFDKDGTASNQVPFTLSATVPGRLRWVTTYIARWDSDIDWPNDLDFELRINKDLHTYAGLPIDNPTYRRYTTSKLFAHIESVSSQQMMNATDGLWDAYTAPIEPGVPEVPPDGRVRIRFSHPVEVDMVASALQLIRADDPNDVKTISVDECSSPGRQVPGPRLLGARSSKKKRGQARSRSFGGVQYGGSSVDLNRCVEVTVTDEAALEVETVYIFRIKQGSQTHSLAGPLSSNIDFRVSGLQSFAFPFINKLNQQEWFFKPLYRRHLLWLRHGLAAEVNTTEERNVLAEIASSTVISPSLSEPIVITRPSKARLQILGKFEPNVEYSIFITGNSNVRDSFGLPLVTSRTRFTTEKPMSFFVEAHSSSGVALFDQGFGDKWHVMTRGKDLIVGQGEMFAALAPSERGPHRLGAAPILSLHDARKAVRALLSDRISHPDGGSENESVEAPLQEDFALAVDKADGSEGLDVGPLLQPSGLFITNRWDHYAWDCGYSPCAAYIAKTSQLVCISDVGATVIHCEDGTLVWVTRMQDAADVSGATVVVYSYHHSHNSHHVTELFRNVTGPDGTCMLPTVPTNDMGYATVMGFIEHNGRLTPHMNWPMQTSAAPADNLRATLVTDRRLYKDGDVVHVKGYVRVITATGQTLSASASTKLSLRVQWNRERQESVVTVPVSLRPDYGTFEADLPVPSDASYGENSISLSSGDGSNWMGYTTHSRRLKRSNQAPHAEGFFSTDVKDSVGRGSAPSVGISNPYIPHSHLTSASITIADPRIPSVVMTLSSDELICKPGLPLKITVTTKTYAGTAVGAASVNVDWTVHHSKSEVSSSAVVGLRWLMRSVPLRWYDHGFSLGEGNNAPSPSLSQGSLVLVTHPNGSIDHDLIFARNQLAQGIQQGDTVEIIARWTGPTREELRKTLSFPVAPSEVQLSVLPSVTEVVPGLGPMALAVDVQKVVGGGSVLDKTVDVRVYEWDGVTPASDADPHSGELSVPGCTDKDPVATCSVKSDGAHSFSCILDLPAKVVKYLAIATTVDEAGYKVSTVLPMGHTPSEWRSSPLRSMGDVVMVTDKSSYAEGDTAHIVLMSPLVTNGRALVKWGNRLAKRTSTVDLLAGLNSIPVPLGSECSELGGGCQVTIAIVTPRTLEGSVVLAEEVVVSRLLDINAPRSFISSITLTVQPTQNDIQVAVTSDVAIAAPGQPLSIQVSVTDASGRPLSGEAEAYVVVVDQALLDLVPYPLPALNSSFPVSLVDYISGSDSRQSLGSAVGYQDTIDVTRRRIGLDPWVTPGDWSLGPHSSHGYYPYVVTGDIDLPDDVFFPRLTSQITLFPSDSYFNPNVMPMAMSSMRGSVGMQAMSMATDESAAAPMESARMMSKVDMADAVPSSFSMPLSADAGATGPPSAPSAAENPTAVSLRSHFESTPLVQTIDVDATGIAHITFNLPDNVATYAIRVIVTSKANPRYFAQAETSVVSRRALSLQPSVPRIVRLSDRFECGAVVIASEAEFDADVTVSAELQVDAGAEASALVPLRITSQSSENSVRVTGITPVEFKFAFEAAALGDAKIVLRAHGNNVADALEAIIPVKAQQEKIYVATSMAIEADADGKTWDEGIELPDAVPGSGSILLHASVGRLAAVESIGQLLLDDVANNANGETLSAALATHASLQYYIKSDKDTQRLRGGRADNGSVAAAAEAMFTSALSSLWQYTTPTRGLRRVLLDNYPHADWVDTYLNARAIFLANRASSHGLVIPNTLVSMWRHALATGLEKIAMEAQRWNGHFNDFDLLAYARLALGRSWQAQYHVANDLSMERLIENIDRCSVGGKAATALVMLFHKESAAQGDERHIKAILDFLISSIRIQGRTAYVASYANQPYPASQHDNALALAALVRGGAAREPGKRVVVEKLANWVARGPSGSSGMAWGFCYWSPFDWAFSSLALAMYDSAKHSTEANVALRVMSSTHEVLAASFVSPSITTVSKETPWEEVLDNGQAHPAPLLFTARGQGEVSVAAMLAFVPAVIYNYPIYRGIYVERVIQLRDPVTQQPLGPPIGMCQVGASLIISIQVTTPDSIDAIEVVELLVGGLEAQDPSVDPAAVFDQSFAFTAREVRKDQVRLSASNAWAGTHSVSYGARAVTTGVFVLPPTRAYAVKQPELMGLAPGGTFTVGAIPVSAEDAAKSASYVVSQVKSCPAGKSMDGSELKAGVVVQATASAICLRERASVSLCSLAQIVR